MQAINWLLLRLGDAAQWLWHDAFGAIGELFAALSGLLNPLLAPLFSWINVVANGVAGVVFAPIGMVPGWLSNTVISAVTGVFLLLVFKYTSNQDAIGRVKDDIKANMLALKLFKDELGVVFRAQLRVFRGALRMLRYALFPLAVMMVPVLVELAQMGLWYQWRPLQPGEETLLTVQLAADPSDDMPGVELHASPGAEIVAGPVRVWREREVVWRIRGVEPGRHELVFEVNGRRLSKSLEVGEGFRRVSALRPGWSWTDILLHPLERPYGKDAPVRSVSIDYPGRDSWTAGSDWWVVYFFVASMVFALIFKPLVKVKI